MHHLHQLPKGCSQTISFCFSQQAWDIGRAVIIVAHFPDEETEAPSVSSQPKALSTFLVPFAALPLFCSGRPWYGVALKNSQMKNRQGRKVGRQIHWRAFRGREKMIKGEEGLAARGR